MTVRVYLVDNDPGTRSLVHKIRYRTVGNSQLFSRIATRVRREWGADAIAAMDDHDLKAGPVGNVLTDIILGNDQIARRDAVRDLVEVHEMTSIDDTAMKALDHVGVDPVLAVALARLFDYSFQNHETVLVMGNTKPAGMMIDVRLGRNLRLLPDLRLMCQEIPEAVATSLIGRPLRELVQHPALPEEDAITRIETMQGNAIVSAIAPRDRALQELAEETRTTNSKTLRKIT